MAEARGVPAPSPRGFAMAPGHGLDSLAAVASAEGRSGLASRHDSPAGSAAGKMDVKAAAQRIADQPVPVSRPDLWGLLTAVSDKARKRPQGAHIMLYGNEHVLGRVVKEVSCSFDSPNVSGKHCRIMRKIVTLNGSTKSLDKGYSLIPGERIVVTVKDSSSNGTYINQHRLKRDGAEECLKHGDLISLVGPPELENAFAFVYRDVTVSNPPELLDFPKQGVKRKELAGKNDQVEEGNLWDGKRMKGLLIGGSEGPVCLDDVRRLQRSNEELREQLEEHVSTVEKLKSEYRAAESRHETELKEARDSITSKFAGDLERNLNELENKNKEIRALNTRSTLQQSVIEDLNQRLVAASQSRVDAEELIQSQKANITDLEKRVEEERELRKGENEDAQVALRAAVERARNEAAEEIKQQAEAVARQQKQLNDKIVELQETDKENRRVTENLRSKLEKGREALVNSEEKFRRLEAQLQEERNTVECARKRAADREQELENIRKELEAEKEAKQTATVRASSLELEMETAIRELALEKRRLQGARERIVLRETQLRAFHSTAAEIAALQQKQQDQLTGMLRTLEDGEYEEQGGPRTQDDVDRTTPGLDLEKPTNIGGAQAELGNGPLTAGRDHVEATAAPEYGVVQGSNKVNGSIPTAIPINDGELPDRVAGLHEKVEARQDETQQEWLGGETEEEDCSVVADSESSDTSMAGDLDVVQDTLIDDEESKEVSCAARFPLEAVTAQVKERVSMEASRVLKVEELEENVSSPVGTPSRFTFRRLSIGERIVGGAVKTSLTCPDSPCTEQLEGRNRGGNADARSTFGCPNVIAGETMLVDEDVTLKDLPYWGRTQVVGRDEDKDTENTDSPHLAGVKGSSQEVEDTDPARDFVRKESASGSQVGRDRTVAPNVSPDKKPDLVLMNERQATEDLLASEVAGSWAASSPSSERSRQDSRNLNGNRSCDLVETDYPGAGSEEHVAVEVASSQVGTSDIRPATGPGQPAPNPEELPDARSSQTTLAAQLQPLAHYQGPGNQRMALNEMFSIVAPELTRLHGLQQAEQDAPDSEGSTDEDSDELGFGQRGGGDASGSTV